MIFITARIGHHLAHKIEADGSLLLSPLPALHQRSVL